MPDDNVTHGGRQEDRPDSPVDRLLRIERICDEFEDAWNHGDQPKIVDYAPEDPALRVAALCELVQIDLARRIKAGESVRLELYLEPFPELQEDAEAFLELIVTEYNLRRTSEPQLNLDEYVDRFPHAGKKLAERLAQSPGKHRRRFPLRLNCPHCQNPIQIVDDGESDELVCPSCGSGFRVQPEKTVSWSPEKLPKLGKFELIEAVGRGAFGTVYRAQDTELDRIVAVKVPRSGTFVTDDDEDRFVREARSTAQLHHSGIVPVYEVGHTDSSPYIVTQYVDGITLADALTGRRFSFTEAAEIISQVADALQHSHEHGVVHRDLKPSNIMLQETDGLEARLMDFGLARRDEGEITVTVEGNILGTPAYMSPEQARGEAHRVDGRSDVYSLGVVFYQLLAGELPFRGNSRMLLHQVVNTDPQAPRKLNDRIPRDLETICLKCLEKDPQRRYSTAADVAIELRRFLRGEPIVARPVGRLARAWRWCKRNTAIAALTATAALLLIAVAVVGMVGYIQTDRALETVQHREVEARAARATAENERDNARRAREAETSQRRLTERNLVDTYSLLGVVAHDQNKVSEATLWFAKAARLADDYADRQLANRTRVRNWLRHALTPVAACQMDAGYAMGLVLHPSGRFVMALDRHHRPTIWSVAVGEEIELSVNRGSSISAAAWNVSGNRLAIGSRSGTVKLLSFPALEPLEEFTHTGPISSLRFDADDNFLAVASSDVRLWCVERKDYVEGKLAHPKPVDSITFAPEADAIITSCLDGKARVFRWMNEDLPDECLYEPIEHSERRIEWGIWFPPLLAANNTLLARSSIHIWQQLDLSTGRLSGPMRLAGHVINSAAVTADGRYAVLGGPARLSYSV